MFSDSDAQFRAIVDKYTNLLTPINRATLLYMYHSHQAA